MNQSIILEIARTFLGPLIVGIVIWYLGNRSINVQTKNEAIRELMTYRGDLASIEFRRALNKVSITFHGDSEIREEVRDLYDAINNPSLRNEQVNRKIVGLIYNLCRKHGFDGLTEYDIDQAFPETKQEPEITPKLVSLEPVNSAVIPTVKHTKELAKNKVKADKKKS